MARRSLLYRLAKRVLLLDVTHLFFSSTATIPFEAGKFQFRKLQSSDIIRFAKDPKTDLDAGMAHRLDFGIDDCFAAFDGPTLVGYCWVARQNIEPNHNEGDHPATGVGVSFPDDTCFLYKAFTNPDWRGQQVFPRVMGYAAQQLGRRGILRVTSTTDWSNQPAIRAFERSGFESIGKIWRIGRVPSLTLCPAKASEFGIQTGSRAKCTSRKMPAATLDHAFA